MGPDIEVGRSHIYIYKTKKMVKKYTICTTIKDEHAKFLKEEGRKVSEVLEDAIERLIKLKRDAEDPDAPESNPLVLRNRIGFLQKKINDMNMTIEEFIVRGQK